MGVLFLAKRVSVSLLGPEKGTQAGRSPYPLFKLISKVSPMLQPQCFVLKEVRGLGQRLPQLTEALPSPSVQLQVLGASVGGDQPSRPLACGTWPGPVGLGLARRPEQRSSSTYWPQFSCMWSQDSAVFGGHPAGVP